MNSDEELMKLKSITRKLGAVVLAAALFSAPGEAATHKATQQSSAEQEVMQLDRELLEARRQATKGDTTVLERILADDFIATSLNGRVTNKTQYIKNSTSPNLSFDAFSTDDVKVRVYGDGAVVTGRTTVKGHYKDEEFTTSFRYTRGFVKRNGRWQIVTSHLTPISKQ